MTKNPDTVSLSLEDLLDLSMCVGKSSEFETAIKVFLDCLVKKIPFAHCEVWRQNNEYFTPIYPKLATSIILNSYDPIAVQQIFPEKDYTSCYLIDDKQINKVAQQASPTKMHFQSCHLQEGYYFLFAFEHTQKVISPADFDILLPIFQRFGFSLQILVDAIKTPLELIDDDFNSINQDLQANKLIVENISEGLMICDLTGKILFTNNRLLELAEYDRNDILDKCVSEIPLPEKNTNEILSMLKRVFSNGESFEYLVLHQKKKSKINWYPKCKISPYRNTKGRIIGAIALIRDVTAEIKAARTHQALTESKDQYNLVINQGFDGVLTFDMKAGKLLDINEAFLKNIGYERDQFLRAKVEEVSPPYQPNGKTSKAYLEEINQFIKNSPQGKINYEWVHQRKDGTLYYTEIIALRLNPPNEHIKIEIHQDITQRYLAQKELEENRERLNKFFDRSPIAVHIRSIDSHNFERVNQKFTELFGYTVDELNQLDRKKLVVEEDQQFIKEQMNRLYNKEIHSFRNEKQYIRKNGEIFWGAATRSLVELKNETVLIGFIEDITKQKEAQSALEESEAKVRSIFNSTTDVIISLDPGLNLVYFNKAADVFMKNYYGKAYKIEEYFKPPNRPIDKDMLAFFNLALNGEANTFRKTLSYQGKERIDLINVLPNRDPKGKVIGIIIYGKDITPLEEAQKAVKNSRALLQMGERVGKFGNWEIDLEKESIQWSEGMYPIFERAKDKGPILLKELDKYVQTKDLPVLKKQMDLAKQRLPVDSITIQVYTDKGKLIYLHQSVENVFKNGKLVKIFGTSHDITDLKKAEELANDSNRRYKDLFDNMYDALLTMNKDGFFEKANKAIERLTEYSLEQLQQLNISDLVHPEDAKKSQQYLDKLRKDGYYSNYQGRIITRTGKIKYVQVNANAIIKNGEMIGSRNIVRDITELKIAEQKREQLYVELEQVNKELKDFAYIVSHDLKAPLRAISSLSSWIAEDYKHLFDEEGKHHIELLIGRADRMQKFIEGILEYSRLGRTKTIKEEIDVIQLINEIIIDLNPIKQFTINIEHSIPKITGQKIRIQQVFQNLIGNAIKYNDKEFGQISIGYEMTDTHHFFSIEDNGPGIEEKHFEKIFQIFQTLQSRDELESTGVGLTIVKKIVELHGGEITITSELGSGTKFTFSIEKYT